MHSLVKKQNLDFKGKFKCLVISILVFISIFSNFYIVSTSPNITFTDPSYASNYITNKTYYNLTLDITDTDNENTSTFIDWNNSLMGYWNFEKIDAGSTPDNSTKDNDAIFISRTQNNFTTGKFGNAFCFNGTDTSYLKCTTNPSLNISDEITIEAWIKENATTFNQTLDSVNATPTIDYGHSVRQTNDGGYIVTGQVNYSDGVLYSGDLWLVKFGINGNKEWEKTYGHKMKQDAGYYVNQTRDDGYIIVGISNTTDWTTDGDIWLIKTDSQGNHEWNKTFDGGGFDVGYCVQQTNDNGYVIVGETNNSANSKANDIWLIRTNSLGEKDNDESTITNDWKIGGTDDEGGWSIRQTSDDGYVLTGYTESYAKGGSGKDLWILKTNATADYNGTDPKNITFNVINGSYLKSDEGRDIEITLDGYISIGYTTYNNPKKDIWILELNSTGSITNNWSDDFGSDNNHDTGFSIVETSDNSYIFASYEDYDDIGSHGKMTLTKIDSSDGSIIWNRTYGDSAFFKCGLNKTSDGGFIITTNGTFNENYNLLLVKTDSNGNIKLKNNQNLTKTIVGKKNSSYDLTLTNGTISGTINNNILTHKMKISDLALNWTHICFTYNGTNMKLYINGSLKNTSSNYNRMINTTSNNLTIGKNFSGIIDEIRLWNRSLSYDEIKASFSSKVYDYTNNFTGLIDSSYPYIIHSINTSGYEYTNNSNNITVDTVNPTSSAEYLLNYNHTISDNITINITAIDSNSGLKNITIYYYNSTNNYTWDGPYIYNNFVNTTPWLDTSNIQIWFNFTDVNRGSGYYRFYSIAVDNASNTELFNDNDTNCYYGHNNRAPNASILSSPTDGDTNKPISTDISWSSGGDLDGDSLTYTVFFADNNPPTTIISNNQSSTSYDPGALSYSKTYYWRIITYDNHSIGTPSNIWSFTTKDEPSGGGNGNTGGSTIFFPNVPNTNTSNTNTTDETEENNQNNDKNITSNINSTIEEKNIGNITSGNKTTIKLKRTNQTSIKDIEILSTESIKNVKITIEKINKTKLSSKKIVPKEIILRSLNDEKQKKWANSSYKNLKVYKYLNISLKSDDKYYSKPITIKINFTIEKTWIDENTTNISLLRNKNESWTNLNTTLMDENSTHYFYRSETSGLSTFAIVGGIIVETNEPYSTEDRPDPPWLLIIGFITASIIILLIFLFKFKYIYVEEKDKEE